VISQTLAAFSLTTLIGQPIWKLYKFFSVPGRLDQVKRKNVSITLAVATAVLAFVFLVPLPYRIMCSLEVKPRDAEPVYVSVPGQLAELHVKPGDQVSVDQPLARLVNLELELEVARLEGKRDEYITKLESLQRDRYDDASAALQLPQVEESLAAIEEQLTEKRRDAAQLLLMAPKAGTVLPPPETGDRAEGTGQLPTWSGTPLDRRNLGAYFESSALFCQIGDPRQLEAQLIIDQDDIELVKTGDELAIKIDELPNETFHSTITEIANLDLKISPKRLSNKAGGELITQTDARGVERPMNTSYLARAPIEDDEQLLFLGLRGKAKIYARWQTIAERGWRFLARTFNFKL
jgi:putative peptide zinc metalloprotease protein